jgi:hypothetical protein
MWSGKWIWKADFLTGLTRAIKRVYSDIVTFGRIYSETMSQLDRFHSRVKEGRDVDNACSFARWLFWSGILDLLKANSTPVGAPAPLKCDGAHLAWKLEQLLESCNEYYRTNKPAGLDKSELDSIREKLDRLSANQDLIAGHLSKLSSTTLARSEAIVSVPRIALFDEVEASE